MAKKVTMEIDAESGALSLAEGTLFLGERAPVAFTGYQPAEGGAVRVTLFGRDGVTPLADNHGDAAELDLSSAALRAAFRGERCPRTFRAVANEVGADGKSMPVVLAAGWLTVEWSPEVFAPADGTVSTLKGDKGEKGEKGDKGDKGDPLTFGDLTAAQQAALRGNKGDKGEKGEKGDKGTFDFADIGRIGERFTQRDLKDKINEIADAVSGRRQQT